MNYCACCCGTAVKEWAADIRVVIRGEDSFGCCVECAPEGTPRVGDVHIAKVLLEAVATDRIESAPNVRIEVMYDRESETVAFMKTFR